MEKLRRVALAASSRAFHALLLAVLLLFAAKLVVDLYARVLFPWDILTCFETSFLSGMLKLHNGLSIYSAPQLANSEVYPPGIHYLMFALLRPFGGELDIRACRAVAALLSLLVALVAGSVILRLLRTLRDGRRSGAWLTLYVFLAAWLLLNKNMTSDQPHPDNLHLLHAAVMLLLTWEALRRASFRWALATVLWSGLSLLTKQTAMFAPIGALTALLLGDRWGAKRSALLLALGAVLPATLFWRLNQGMSGFSLFRTMSNHRLVNVLLLLAQPLVDGGKFTPLILPPRLLMLLLAPPAAALLYAEQRARPFLLAWAASGVFEIAPAFVALLKEGGNFNNLGAIDLWLFLLVMPAALLLHERLTADRAPVDEGALAPAGRVLAAMILLGLTLGLYPLKQTIRSNAWEFCRDVEARIHADLAAGKRLWVPTGAAFLIRAGRTAPIEDLSINIWTAEASGERDLQIYQRLATRYYDRIYFIFPWELQIREEIAKQYVRAERMLGPDYGGHKDHRGVQPYLTVGCDVYEPKPAGAEQGVAQPPSAVTAGAPQAAPLPAGETNH